MCIFNRKIRATCITSAAASISWSWILGTFTTKSSVCRSWASRMWVCRPRASGLWLKAGRFLDPGSGIWRTGRSEPSRSCGSWVSTAKSSGSRAGRCLVSRTWTYRSSRSSFWRGSSGSRFKITIRTVKNKQTLDLVIEKREGFCECTFDSTKISKVFIVDIMWDRDKKRWEKATSSWTVMKFGCIE